MGTNVSRRQKARDRARRLENKRLPPDLEDPIMGTVYDKAEDKMWAWYLRNKKNKNMPGIVHFFYRWLF